MNNDVIVRRVRAGDAARSRAIRIEMLADTPLAFITTLADAASMTHEEYVARSIRSSDGSQVAQFVAEVGERFVGSTTALAHSTKLGRTMIVTVYVTPAYRGGAILARMVDAAAAWSRECGRSTLELEVVTTNTRAIRAYHKLGFVVDGDPLPHPTIPSMREQIMIRDA